MLCRREGGALTSEEQASFQQLVRVVVQHFLPYICKCFSSLFTKSPLTALTLTTTLNSHPRTSHPSHPPPSSSTLSQWAELDVIAMATPLRSLCPDVFSELEQLTHDHVTEIEDHVTENDTVTGDHVTRGDSQVTGDDVTTETTEGGVNEPDNLSPSPSPPPPPSPPPSPPSTSTV